MRCYLAFMLALLMPATALADHQHATTPRTDRVPLYDNLGSHHHPITTTSPQAQQYFDQGLRLLYGFNHDEAIRAFEEAARLDPECAMAYWGIAFALGPNYNLPREPERDQKAWEAMRKAQALAPKASASDQAYIAALATRHSNDPKADRKAMDRAFADAMRELARRYPDDTDAATLYAESMMVLRPWDLWTLDGQPQPGTLEIVTTLELVLKKEPNHPGANHYYIHAIEASPQPERGVASAERIGKLVPGAGHLVHMPSHIYFRLGRYSDAAASNRDAIAADQAYLAQAKPDGVYPMMYYPHNIHFLWFAATMLGRQHESMQAARDVSSSIPPEMAKEMPMLEYFMPTLWFGLIRFGAWDEMLRQPAPPRDLSYTLGMWHYARGIALAATQRFDEAAREQAELARIAAAMPTDRIVGDNQPAAALLSLAEDVLAGEIAVRRGDSDAAIQNLEAAIRIQDELPFTEPPPWYYPVRQSLGIVFLSNGRARDAEVVYREDLQRNPGNGWSLYGLAQSLRAQGKEAEAADVDRQFRTAWAQADVTLTASRY